MKNLWRLIKETVLEAKRDNLPVYAAGFSYYLLFSIIPLTIVMLAVLGRVMEAAQARNALIKQVSLFFDTDAGNSFRILLQAATKINTTKAGTLGLVFIFYGATRIFMVLHVAISQIWDKTSKRVGIKGALYARIQSFVLLVVPTLVVLTFFILDAGLGTFKHTFQQYFPGVPVNTILPLISHLISLALFASGFALINKFMPHVRPSWGDVWIGAGVTSAVFGIAKYIFTVSFRVSRISSLFGAAGGIILILIWIYLAMLVFLYGSEFTRVYANQQGSLSGKSAVV